MSHSYTYNHNEISIVLIEIDELIIYIDIFNVCNRVKIHVYSFYVALMLFLAEIKHLRDYHRTE